jgi:MerR family copper efflux transcriptional regulator
LRVRPGSSCSDVREKADEKIADVDEKIRQLRAIKKALVQMAATCSGRGPASTCTILQALNEGVTS